MAPRSRSPRRRSRNCQILHTPPPFAHSQQPQCSASKYPFALFSADCSYRTFSSTLCSNDDDDYTRTVYDITTTFVTETGVATPVVSFEAHGFHWYHKTLPLRSGLEQKGAFVEQAASPRVPVQGFDLGTSLSNFTFFHPVCNSKTGQTCETSVFVMQGFFVARNGAGSYTFRVKDSLQGEVHMWHGEAAYGHLPWTLKSVDFSAVGHGANDGATLGEFHIELGELELVPVTIVWASNPKPTHAYKASPGLEIAVKGRTVKDTTGYFVTPCDENSSFKHL